MSQHPKSTTRRDMLTNVALCAVVTPLVAFSALALAQPVEAADPIYHVIERHRAAYAAFDRLVTEQATHEESIPSERRQSDDSETIVATDDPRWIDFTKRLDAGETEEADASADLASTEPTTLAGVAAVLTYAFEFNGRGYREFGAYEMVDDADDENERPAKWSYFFHRTLARATAKIAEAQS